MATAQTSTYSFPYPRSTDPVNVSGDIEQLATKIDSDLQEIIEDTSSLMWTTGGTFSNGLLAPTYNDTTGKISMSLSQDLRSSASPNFVNLTLTGDAAVNGGDITTSQTTFNLINTTATTLNIGGAGTAINIGNASGKTNFAGDINVATGKVYEINNVSVLSSSALGSGVVSSSLTSVGTITTGTWNATTIAVNRGGTGLTSYTIGDIVYASASTTLAKLAGVATGNALISGGVGAAPSWGKIGLTTHVSGTLGVANGGTGVTEATGSASVVLSNSPSLTGTPIAPTAAVDTNTTQIATTAFVIGQASSTNPAMNGSVAIGSSLRYARSDHVHPIDTSRAPVANPTFTGTVSSTGTQILMSSSASGSPTQNVFFTVKRGSSPDVALRWNEAGDTWQFTNDGTNYVDIGSGDGAGSADEIIGITFFTMGA
jgi:hypothetical protein